MRGHPDVFAAEVPERHLETGSEGIVPEEIVGVLSYRAIDGRIGHASPGIMDDRFTPTGDAVVRNHLTQLDQRPIAAEASHRLDVRVAKRNSNQEPLNSLYTHGDLRDVVGK
jgi:hypothetical protein